MKFVHMADMHFDRQYANISDKTNLGELRRLEQRRIFNKIINYIQQNKIELLLIAGDLWEHEYIKESTVKYINSLFEKIPDTLIFITPGNHDPLLKNSYYNTFKWSNNVKIFKEKVECIETNLIDIYGFGFENFYSSSLNMENLEIRNKNKKNILLMHASLDASTSEERNYNPVSRRILKEKGFDYIALGHIHKREIDENIVYPGSTISHGFDELGSHGIIAGEIKQEEVKFEFISIDEKEFIEVEIDISEYIIKDELIYKINEIENTKDKYIKIILIGNRNFEINTIEIMKLIQDEKIIKIKDFTKMQRNLYQIANENTLKGIFVKKMLNKLENISVEEERQKIEKAIDIALDVLD